METEKRQTQKDRKICVLKQKGNEDAQTDDRHTHAPQENLLGPFADVLLTVPLGHSACRPSDPTPCSSATRLKLAMLKWPSAAAAFICFINSSVFCA